MSRLSREGRASGGAETGSREDTLLLISQYREHEKLFRNVNCKKKSVWELITASMAAENPNFSARPEQVEGKWKSLTLAFASVVTTTVFREMTEKNAHFTGKLQSSMVTGLMFARMRQAAALGRQITCALRPSHKKKS